MRKIFADPRAIDWGKGRISKRHADHLGFQFLEPWARGRGELSVLSLPGPRWIWEQSFTDYLVEGSRPPRLRFYGLEKDVGLHREMREQAPRISRKGVSFRALERSSSLEFLRGYVDPQLGLFSGPPSSTFDLVFMDWMGSWSYAKETELDMMLRGGVLRQDAMLMFTTFLARGRPDHWGHIARRWPARPHTVTDIRGNRRRLPHWRTLGVLAFMEDKVASYGFRVKKSLLVIYATGRGRAVAPQMVTILNVA